MKRKKLFVGFFISILILIIVELVIYSKYDTFGKPKVEVTLILSDKCEAEVENIVNGFSAATGERCDATVIYTDNSALAQFEAISRQVASADDVIIVVPVNAIELSEELKTLKTNAKIIFINDSSSENSSISFVSANEKRLGEEYADFILEKEAAVKAVEIVYSDEYQYNLSDARETLANVLENKGIIVEQTAINLQAKPEFRMPYFLYNNFDVVITMDNGSMDALLQESNTRKQFPSIYSVSNNNKAVYYLDNSQIKGLCYIDEFSVGYVAMSKILGEGSDSRISQFDSFYYLVDKESMYDKQLQNILFPFVK